MNHDDPITTNRPASPADRWVDRFFGLLQWIAFVVIALIALAALLQLRMTGVPSAPITWIYVSAGLGVAVALLHFPYLYWRLPGKVKGMAYGAALASFIVYAATFDGVQSAYSRTPEGIEEAARWVREAEKETAEQERKEATEQALAEAAATQKDVVEYASKLEACFTTFGHHLPGLEDPIKDALQNPRSFEHVKTVTIVPDENRNNVAMVFRAENGFGAVRTATVKAQLIAENCEVQNIGEPQVG